MREIRIAWKAGLHQDDDGMPIDGGAWLLDTPLNRFDLRALVDTGNEIAPGSYWLEERET